MRNVEVRVSRHELRERMATMRIWLDEHRFEPSIFNCRDVGEDVLIHIDFKVASEAEAFAKRFNGRLAGFGGGAGEGVEHDILKSVLSSGTVG